MLKPISYSKWSPALGACQRMMRTFALWLCDPTVKKTSVSQSGLVNALGTSIEGAWLWEFLKREVNTTPLLNHAKTLASLSEAEKASLREWVAKTTDVSSHFSLTSSVPPLPTTSPLASKKDWNALQTLMEAFYSPGLTNGLPFDADGVATLDKSKQVTYTKFKEEFVRQHKFDKNDGAREICVMCGAEQRKAHVDHWVAKAKYPLLSICADNLIPMCDDCNEAPNKGSEPVHTKGAFQDWFHPHKRHPAGKLELRINFPVFTIEMKSKNSADAQRVVNLNRLLKLEARWSKELRAEYRKVQRSLETQQVKKQAPLTFVELYQSVFDWTEQLSQAEPNHEVHQVLAKALLEPARLLAWLTELEKDFEEKHTT